MRSFRVLLGVFSYLVAGSGRKLLPLAFAAALAIFLAGVSKPVAGQAVNGTVIGTITDATKASVAGAKVTLTEESKNVARTAVTNENGF